MISFEPFSNGGAEFDGEVDELPSLLRANMADGIVFGRVAFVPAGIEIVSIALPLDSEDHGQGLQGAVMGEVFSARYPSA